MKTSNKILLALLLCSFGFLVFAQVGLHIKYARNDYVPDGANLFNDQYKLTGIKHVRLLGVGKAVLVNADKATLQIEKRSPNYIHYSVAGDTLIIRGEYPTEHFYNFRGSRETQTVTIAMPVGVDVYSINSDIDVQGDRKDAGAVTRQFDINNSVLYSRVYIYDDTVHRYFDTLNVTAKNSSVNLFRNDHFKAVNLQYNNSYLNDNKAKIGQLNLAADSASTIVVGGVNMGKLQTFKK